MKPKTKSKTKARPTPPPSLPVFVVRGHRVILDADLARVYGVPTKVFNQAIKRNAERFPEDFAFQLTADETANMRSQIVTTCLGCVEKEHDMMWSQFASTSPDAQTKVGKYRRKTHLPWAFTEHGAVMAANLLRSEQAVRMSVYVVRAFVGMREQLAANAAVLRRLAEVDKTLLEHDQALKVIWTELQPLLAPPPEPPKRRIGFRAADDKV